MFVCILCVFFCFILHSCCIIVSTVGFDLMGLKPNPLDLSSLSALTLLVGSFDPYKPIHDMTYNVFGGMLSLTQSIDVE